MVRIHGLNAEEELCQVVEHPPGEGVVVLTPRILQIIVSLVVEHLIGGQIHSSIQKREARQEPAQTTEDESFNETNDVEESPTLHSDAVASKEYSDGAVDSDRHGEHQEPASVAQTNTVVDVGTMMIKLSNTPVTDPAVFSSERSDSSAGVTQSENIQSHLSLSSVVLPLIVVSNLFDGSVIVVSVLGQEAGILLVCNQETDPHDQVDDDEDVVQSRQQVPCNRNTPQEVHWISPE